MKKIYIIKTCIVVALLVIVGFGSITFADDIISTDGQEKLKTVGWALHLFISILNRGRIFFANIAGKLLTNSRIYAEGVGMDRYLWLLRNMVRNISNYLLWFIFIFFLFKTLISQEEPVRVVKDIIIRILIAGVGIQASWFLVAATLDLSTIGVAAVGALPAQLLSTNTNFIEGIKLWWMFDKMKSDPTGNNDRTIENKLIITLFPESNDNNVKFIDIQTGKLNEPIESSKFIDSFLYPKADTVAWPLIFVGASIINNNDINPPNLGAPVSAFMKLLIDGFGIIIYGVAMILLCVIAFIRVVYLWLFIVLSPVIVLLIALGDKMPGANQVSAGLKSVGLGVESFFLLVFKPVIVVLGITAMLIFSVLMNKVIQEQEPSFGGLTLIQGTTIETKTTSSDNQTENIRYQTSIDSGPFQVVFREMSKGLGQVLLSFLTVVFMWFIVKMALTTGGTGIGWFDKAFKTYWIDWAEKELRDIPIIPVAGGLGINDIKNDQGTGLFDAGKKAVEHHISGISEEHEKDLREARWRETNELGKTEMIKLQESVKFAKTSWRAEEFIGVTKSISDKGQRIWLINDTWTKHFVDWLNTVEKGQLYDTNARKLKEQRGKNNGTIDDLEQLLNKSENLKNYRALFGWTGTPPTSYKEAKQKPNFK